jgi:ABC-2 type transport system ATP-binding protein
MAISALEVTDLRHRYGDRESLRGLGFSVGAGDMFALLGPNGGGKTTLFRIISTLIKPTSGTVEVFGIDVTKQPSEARKRLGVVFQSAGGPWLTVSKPSPSRYLACRAPLARGIGARWNGSG